MGAGCGVGSDHGRSRDRCVRWHGRDDSRGGRSSSAPRDRRVRNGGRGVLPPGAWHWPPTGLGRTGGPGVALRAARPRAERLAPRSSGEDDARDPAPADFLAQLLPQHRPRNPGAVCFHEARRADGGTAVFIELNARWVVLTLRTPDDWCQMARTGLNAERPPSGALSSTGVQSQRPWGAPGAALRCRQPTPSPFPARTHGTRLRLGGGPRSSKRPESEGPLAGHARVPGSHPPPPEICATRCTPPGK
jgi:hypothetical protein